MFAPDDPFSSRRQTCNTAMFSSSFSYRFRNKYTAALSDTVTERGLGAF